MGLLLKILLALFYPFVLLARVMNALQGKDRMRLREPEGVTTFWLERSPKEGTEGYFSEASATEGSPQNGTAPRISKVLLILAHVYAPTRQNKEKEFVASADRNQGIPDEVYTLW